MRILGISGSLRRDSYNTKLLREAGRLLPPGVELETPGAALSRRSLLDEIEGDPR